MSGPFPASIWGAEKTVVVRILYVIAACTNPKQVTRKTLLIVESFCGRVLIQDAVFNESRLIMTLDMQHTE
ncbi:MAG: hypothetical protein AB1847_20365 [bacterium]